MLIERKGFFSLFFLFFSLSIAAATVIQQQINPGNLHETYPYSYQIISMI